MKLQCAASGQTWGTPRDLLLTQLLLIVHVFGAEQIALKLPM